MMGRSIVITGASGSMGTAAVEALAAEGWRVIMACRNLSKAASVRRVVLSRHPYAVIELRQLDLSSLHSVMAFAESLAGERIDVLFNNAGTICRDWSLTEDGYERSFQVNFLAPALLTIMLSDNVGKVVSMVSLTCSLVNIGEDYTGDDRGSFSQLGSYARAKLSMLLFSLELSRRKGIKVDFSDPGVVNSNMISMGRWFDPVADIIFRPLCSSPQKGVRPALNAIRNPLCGGAFTEPDYYVGKRVRKVNGKFTMHPASRNLYSMIEGLHSKK